jgi:3-deoxy-7-phosphoheptulonate synthase
MDTVESTADEGAVEISSLSSPSELKRRIPRSEAAERVVRASRRTIADVLHGRDRRLLTVVGPCSVHDRGIALEYAERLRSVAEATRERLVVVMRTYLEKPRTTVGWKGLVNDPYLDGSCDVAAGLEIARRLLVAINELGVPCGSELLDPTTHPYLVDLLSWAAIGARTSQSQIHREMASGLPTPVGFKNGTDGCLQGAVDAMKSAGRSHTFVRVGADGTPTVVRTYGNPNRHVILRGGGGRPNYGREDVERSASMVVGEAIARPVMIDCSHDNSGKDHRLQASALREVLRQVRAGESRIAGILLESNLRPGKQDWRRRDALEYGVSITDACIGWEETERLLYEAAGHAA